MRIIRIVTIIILASITVYLLVQLFLKDHFTNSDYILLIILCSSGAIKLTIEFLNELNNDKKI
jgi:hypothetical protein